MSQLWRDYVLGTDNINTDFPYFFESQLALYTHFQNAAPGLLSVNAIFSLQWPIIDFLSKKIPLVFPPTSMLLKHTVNLKLGFPEVVDKLLYNFFLTTYICLQGVLVQYNTWEQAVKPTGYKTRLIYIERV